MKLPNSYGSVIKLGGKRRKPYAVSISKLVEDDTGKGQAKIHLPGLLRQTGNGLHLSC